MHRLPRFLWAMTAMAASCALVVCIYTQALRRRSVQGPQPLRPSPRRSVVRELAAARRGAREPAPYELTASLARQAMFGSSR
jgi:hypothetical protein